ncbi:hypothetical protein PILCRDRAFT_644065 [Piloderma croceum F 1598]|uniref:Secreted protein n=1 Tax=Piloderma croceum (strain F 1598) TaxID=765440 RepID=A0A0C3EVC1_PILCF|nr:hypothetical protein PILCRDRAFT_644065 [Piloderma croceum F 1598]
MSSTGLLVRQLLAVTYGTFTALQCFARRRQDIGRLVYIAAGEATNVPITNSNGLCADLNNCVECKIHPDVAILQAVEAASLSASFGVAKKKLSA